MQSEPVHLELRKEVAMIFINNSHFMRSMLKKDSPILPISDYWRRYHDEITYGLDCAYMSKVDKFRILVSLIVSIKESIDLENF